MQYEEDEMHQQLARLLAYLVLPALGLISIAIILLIILL
ncbi:hypothetical protein FHW36_102617 [Chitinophaga polysaccharea]|uniref:Uncharacterized protein n=1 Tax=Chitinophaga polysaccharea TaxID=1293035 RepID=A0A561PXM1_9BACT|nr:hypothetical protein FHW36_102617 [Chitinophaga polysaccharea]